MQIPLFQCPLLRISEDVGRWCFFQNFGFTVVVCKVMHQSVGSERETGKKLQGSLLKGRFGKRVRIDLPVPLPVTTRPPTVPPPSLFPIGTRTPLRKRPPVKNYVAQADGGYNLGLRESEVTATSALSLGMLNCWGQKRYSRKFVFPSFWRSSGEFFGVDFTKTLHFEKENPACSETSWKVSDDSLQLEVFFGC